MALTEALRFLITSDSAQARADLGRLGSTTTEAMSGLDKLKAGFGAGLGAGAGFGAVDAGLNALSRVGTFAVDQAQQAISAASDLQQAQGAVSAIFREASGEVTRFGRNAAESVGLSNAAGDAGHPQHGGLQGILLFHFGDRHVKFILNLRNDTFHHHAFFFQRGHPGRIQTDCHSADNQRLHPLPQYSPILFSSRRYS